MIPEMLRWYEPQNQSPEETLQRVLDVEDCRALVSRKIYLYNQQLWETELETLWTKEHTEDASYGSPWGFYTGINGIVRYYEAQAEALPSVGLSLFRTVNTPVIFIAGDGKTAQGMFLMSGEETFGEEKALHIYGRVAVDFVREKEGWKLLHWVDIYNMTQKVGEDIAATRVTELPEEALLRPLFLSGQPDLPMVTHYPEYHGTDGWPRYPRAHETMEPMTSYGPEGHPAFMKDVQDVNWLLRQAQLKAWGRTVEAK